MDITVSGRYKSIKDIEWKDVPQMAVLTGPNGSGKTQLLEVIYEGLTQARLTPSRRTLDHDTTVSLSLALGPHEIEFVPTANSLIKSSSAKLSNIDQALHSSIKSLKQSRSSDPGRYSIYQFIEKVTRTNIQSTGNDSTPVGTTDIATFLNDNPHYISYLKGPIASLAFIFQRYVVKEFDEYRKHDNKSKEDIRSIAGPPPWEVLNDALKSAQFRYRVQTPDKTSYAGTYKLEFIGDDGVLIEPTSLSSGEQTLLGLIAWLYMSETRIGLPKLLLLDEPDAHLHPALTMQLRDIIVETLVAKYGLHVILTTHSPSTVALMPEESVFIMDAQDRTPIKPNSKWDAVSLLTSGFVGIGPSVKYCVVEDYDDKAFYALVVESLTKRIPEDHFIDCEALSPTPVIEFIPVSKADSNGGASKVKRWVETIEATHIHGIIDRDATPDGSERVHALSRYEWENYIFDPLVISVYLATENKFPIIDGVTLEFGREFEILEKTSDELQAIIDTVVAPIEQRLCDVGILASDYSTGLEEVRLVSGQTVSYPEWLLYIKGRNFTQTVKDVYGAGIKDLKLAFQRGGLVPLDLLMMLQRIQRA